MRSESGMAFDSSMNSRAVLGYLELKGRALILSVNSAERAEQGRAMLTDLLGSLVRPSLTSIRTVEQALAERDAGPSYPSEDELPPEVARQIALGHLDRHYREVLDQPIPSLGGKTPREAVRSSSASNRTSRVCFCRAWAVLRSCEER